MSGPLERLARYYFSQGRNYVEKLPSSQRDLLQDFVAAQRTPRHAWHINEELRAGRMPPEVEELDAILKGAPRAQEPFIVNRGQWLDMYDDPAYLSASIEPGVAEAYAEALNSVSDGRKAGVLRYIAPQRTPLVAPDLGDYYADDELLLPRGLKVYGPSSTRSLGLPPGYRKGGLAQVFGK